MDLTEIREKLVKEQREIAENIEKVEKIEQDLLNDKNYINYKKLKNELYEKTYYDKRFHGNRKLYIVISDIVRTRIKSLERSIINQYNEEEQKDIKDEIDLFYSDIFNSIDDKSFTSYMNAINEVNKTMNIPLEHKPTFIYNKALKLTQEDFKQYSHENLDNEISRIYFLVVFFSIYEGFLKEFLLSLYCKALGLSVGINREVDKRLDIDYAIDLYVYSKKTKRSIAIQLKPLSYRLMKDNYKLIDSNNRMLSFKNDYKGIKELQDHNLVHTMYALYHQNNGLEGFCTLKDSNCALMTIDEFTDRRKYIDKNKSISLYSLAYNIDFICNRFYDEFYDTM